MLNASSPRILYVDEYQSRRDLVSKLLWVEKCDYAFSFANSSTDALELIAGEPFSLYILENNLPGMTGVELCRRIRRTDKHTPILFFAKEARPFERETCFAAGANEFLIKAQDSQRITGVIRRLLNDSVASKLKSHSPCFLAK